jgi:hypothetical protein
MTIEDQVVAMFAKANPVPSLDLLDPIEPLDIDSLSDRSERSREMSDVQTITAIDAEPRRRWWLPALAGVGGLLVAIPLLMNLLPIAGSSTPAEQVANEFMTAVNEHDGAAIREMWAVESNQDEMNPDEWPVITEFDRVMGLQAMNVDCVELAPTSFPDGTGAIAVECSSMLQTDLVKALGLAATHVTTVVYVSDGEVLRVTENVADPDTLTESQDEFWSWAERTDPDGYEGMNTRMEEAYPTIDAEIFDYWEQRVDEFIAEMEAAG